MRVTFVLPFAGMSGGIRVAAIYAAALQRRGHQVTLVSVPAPVYGRRRRLAAHIRVMLGGQWAPAGPSYLNECDIDHRVLATERPVVDSDVPDADVVIATWWRTAEWVHALSPAKGAKAYFIQGFEAFPGQPRERVEATWRMPMHKITIAHWLVRLARDRFGDSEVSFVPNSVDCRQFHAPARSKQIVPTVGYVYSSVPFKGSDNVRIAIERIRQRIASLRVVSFGSAEPTDQIPLPPRTEFVLRPAQEKIRDIYASADVWLCGSRSEGFHLPLLEAMACRTPVVSSRIGGAEEAITSGQNGHIVEVDDNAALAERAEELLALADTDWKRVSDAARARAESYTWEDATSLFESALQTAAGRAPRDLSRKAAG